MPSTLSGWLTCRSYAVVRWRAGSRRVATVGLEVARRAALVARRSGSAPSVVLSVKVNGGRARRRSARRGRTCRTADTRVGEPVALDDQDRCPGSRTGARARRRRAGRAARGGRAGCRSRAGSPSRRRPSPPRDVDAEAPARAASRTARVEHARPLPASLDHDVVRPAAGPGCAARRGGRAAQRAQVLPAARHHAADQRDEQQQVDRGEPGRGVDVEQRRAVDHGRERPGAAAVNCATRTGSTPALRQQRPGHGRHRQQEQQDQRGAHAGELPPGPAGQPSGRSAGGGRAAPAGAAVARRSRCRGVSATSDRRGEAVDPDLQLHRQVGQTPVTSSTPTTTSIAPPSRMTQRSGC